MINYPKPATKQCTEKILDQMTNSIYKINEKRDKFDICIFSHIKNQNMNIPVMLTNYETINEKYLSKNDGIKVTINNKIKKIKFGNVKYLNKALGLSVIEVKENNEISFLELDDNLYEKEHEIYYNKESIYIFGNDKEHEISVSYGLINNVIKSEIIYSSYLDFNNRIFTPIFNLSNNKVIGIFKKSGICYNHGIILKDIINEFIY